MGKSLKGKELGWRKLNKLNLVVMQDAINNLRTDNECKNSKKILVDMLEKAVASDLIVKNIAKQINTEITKEEKQPRRVLTVKEKEPLEGFENLVFVTRNNRPTTQFLVAECMEGTMRRIHKKYPDLVFEKVTHIASDILLLRGGLEQYEKARRIG